MSASRIDILELCAVAVADGRFEDGNLLLCRYIECSLGWKHPRDADGKERETWGAIVAGVNFWRSRYIDYLDMLERMSPEFQQNWEKQTNDLIRLYQLLFGEKCPK